MESKYRINNFKAIFEVIEAQLAEIGSSALPPDSDCRVLNFFLYQKLIYEKYIFQKNSKKFMIFFFFS